MERFNIKGFHCTDSEKAGTMNVKGGYFLSEDIRQFENGFFGIHHLEATFGKFSLSDRLMYEIETDI